jgi:leucyl aminopeptidase (aminopeptidase T)
MLPNVSGKRQHQSPQQIRWSLPNEGKQSMIDPRITKLADTLINFSCGVKPGEKILFELIDIPHEFGIECARIAGEAGAHPLILLKSNQINRA